MIRELDRSSHQRSELLDQLDDLNQILSVVSLGWGKDCIRFGSRSDQNYGYHGNRKLPLTYNGKNGVPTFLSHIYQIFVKLAGNKDRYKISDELEFGPGGTFHYGVTRPWVFPLILNWENGVSIFSQLLWIQSSSNLQITRTGIKSQINSNFDRIWPIILELHALERWKKKSYLQLFSVTFDWIFVKLAGTMDRHKSSNEFEFGPDRMINFGVICPWAQIFILIDLKWERGKTMDFSGAVVM